MLKFCGHAAETHFHCVSCEMIEIRHKYAFKLRIMVHVNASYVLEFFFFF